MRYIPRYRINLSPLFDEPPKLTTVELLAGVYSLLDILGARTQNSALIAAEEETHLGKYIFHVRSQADPAVAECGQELHVRFNNARRGSWSGEMSSRLCPGCAQTHLYVFDTEAQLINEPAAAIIGDEYAQTLLCPPDANGNTISAEQLFHDWLRLIWQMADANSGYDLEADGFNRKKERWLSGQTATEDMHQALTRWLMSLLDETRSGKHLLPGQPHSEITAQMSEAQALLRDYLAYTP